MPRSEEVCARGLGDVIDCNGSDSLSSTAKKLFKFDAHHEHVCCVLSCAAWSAYFGDIVNETLGNTEVLMISVSTSLCKCGDLPQNNVKRNEHKAYHVRCVIEFDHLQTTCSRRDYFFRS